MAAAHRALDAGATRYTLVEGILPLRQVVAERANALHTGPRIEPENVVVTAGTKQALFNACFSLFANGDEVLVPTPGWTSYYEMLRLARAVPVAVCGSPERQFQGDARRSAACGDRETRGLILNSPL